MAESEVLHSLREDWLNEMNRAEVAEARAEAAERLADEFEIDASVDRNPMAAAVLRACANRLRAALAGREGEDAQ